MRTLTITRLDDPASKPEEVRLVIDAKVVDVIKGDEKAKTWNISKGEHAIQVEKDGDGGRVYRSTSYFVIGSKNVSLSLGIYAGSRMTLVTAGRK